MTTIELSKLLDAQQGHQDEQKAAHSFLRDSQEANLGCEVWEQAPSLLAQVGWLTCESRGLVSISLVFYRVAQL